MSWFVGETSLFGLNRILLGRTKVIRFMWIPFFGLMVVGLIITSIISLEQYLNRVTVYQTTFDNTFEGGFPDITVCFNHKLQVKYFYNFGSFRQSSSKDEFYPWINEPDAVRYLGEITNETGILKSRVFVNGSNYVWRSEASNSLYHQIFQPGFKVTLSSTLPQLDITILENVPRKHNFLCVTFQVYAKKMIVFDGIDLALTVNKRSQGYFRVILSEQNTHSAEFDKETILDLVPFQISQVFFRRVIRTNLDSPTNPCHPPTDTVGLYGHRYNYTQGGCIEQRLHHQVETACHCRNTNHILGSAQQPCNQSCVDQQPVVNIRDVAKQCGPLCRSNRLAIEGISTEMRYTTSGAYKSQVELIMTRNVQIEMETEIYTLTKFLSEVGGFSSLFIGFSLAFVFEVLEAIGLYFTSKCKRPPSKVNDHTMKERSSDDQDIFTTNVSYF